jgi:Mrp family chromosome partitioning ATPase
VADPRGRGGSTPGQHPNPARVTSQRVSGPTRTPAPGDKGDAEQRVTAQRLPVVTQPPERVTGMGGGSSARAKALAESVLAEGGDDRTRDLDNVDASGRPVQYLLTGDQIRSSLVPTHQRQRGGAEAPAMTQPYMPVADNAGVEVRVGGVGAEPAVPRTQVWVATHKPPEDPDERLVMVREPDSARAASFRVLRHRLQERGDPRVIAVTSPGPREGKTTCAVNLALALGECGRAKVLLVEANLRSPALAALFGFLPPECFSTQLARHKDKPLDAWSVVEVFSPSLHVLAVKPDADARPLLDGPAFSLALEMLRQANYDYIVIDTPPVLGAADVNLVEDVADGVLFTAWSRETSGRRLRQAIEQLAPAKLLGLALLNV